MTMIADTPAASTTAGQTMGWFARTESWLDAKGRGAWIGSMVVGFVVFWPVGLGLLGYMLINNKFASQGSCRKSRRMAKMSMHTSTGNSAFDAYRADMLRQLEDEQAAFEEFLQRLREAKDKSEFDDFMADRAKAAKEAAAEAKSEDA